MQISVFPVSEWSCKSGAARRNKRETVGSGEQKVEPYRAQKQRGRHVKIGTEVAKHEKHQSIKMRRSLQLPNDLDSALPQK